MMLLQKPKKSLGQNFLIDQNIINKIVKIGNIDKNKSVMEIGPGYGNLTQSLLLMMPKKIVAYEKDKNLTSFLKKKFENNKNIEIFNKDILQLITNRFDNNLIVFGNLPYNISTKILTSFITLEKWPPWYDTLILMFQKEVANRIIAKNQTKDFGRLSILSNWRLNVKKHFDISKNCFFPKPKIDSTLLSFTPKKNNNFYLKYPKTLEKVTRILFSNRRKMINKSFKKLFGKKISETKNLNLDLSKRPEDINSEEYYKIALLYEKLFN